MSGNKAGGLKASRKNIEKYGEDFYARIGSKGGKASSGYKFGWGKVDPSAIGKIGGRRRFGMGRKQRAVV